MRLTMILLLAALALVPGLALAGQVAAEGDQMGGQTGGAMDRPARPPFRRGAEGDGPRDQAGRMAGVFAAHCFYDHRAPNDPIVHPGRIGASHLHDFFGNRTTDATSTYDSLRVGGSSCLSPDDASAYWVPTMTRNGEEVQPTAVHVYYRAFGQNTERVEPFPDGFKIVAGDAKATSPQPNRVVSWTCRGDEFDDQSPTPPSCESGEQLKLQIRFPWCWDGVNVDSPDHQSHMAYGEFGGCPASHPRVLPRLAMNVIYPISGDPGVVTLASGSVYSGHADFFNAWDPDTLSSLVDRCLRGQVQCGTVGRQRGGERS
jgi:hypothetical protein